MAIIDAIVSMARLEPDSLFVVTQSAGFYFKEAIGSGPSGFCFGGATVTVTVIAPPSTDMVEEILIGVFMDDLCVSTQEAADFASTKESISLVLYAEYKLKLQAHLNCKGCCPTPAAQAHAKKELFDSKSMTKCGAGKTASKPFIVLFPISK